MISVLPTNYSFESERLRYRIPSREDAPYAFEALHSDGFMDGMTWEPPKTEKVLEDSIDGIYKAWESGSVYTFSAYSKQNNDFVGRIGIRSSQDEGVWIISYYIHPRHQRVGYATEAAQELVQFGFTTLNAQRIEGFHADFNKASQRTLEKVGMVLIEHIPQSFQKNGVWVADNRFALTKEAWLSQTYIDRT